VIQVLVNYVASRYSRLAPWLLPESLRTPLKNCHIHLAVMACRKANAVMETHSQAINTEVLCLGHRVLWLNILTDVWLGQLCLDTVQPRLGRAYLKDSLALSQKFALPIRTAELLELLAQVDLQCGQLEDCRVKVDSLEELLVAHPTGLKDSFVPATIMKKTCSSTAKAMIQPTKFLVLADSDNNERIRNCVADDFDLELPTATTDAGLMIGANKVNENKHGVPSSPSMKYREESSMGRLESCPHQLIGCLVCSCLVVHQLRISSSLLLATINSRQNRYQTALASLNMAKKRYKVTTENTTSLVDLYRKYIVDKLIKSASNTSLINMESYVTSSMCKARLQYKYSKVEVLALEQKWKEAEESNTDALEWINSQENKLLHREMHFILMFILQGNRIRDAIKEVAEKAAAIAKEESKENTLTPPFIFTGKTPGSRLAKKTPHNQITAAEINNLVKITASHSKYKVFDVYSDEEEPCNVEEATPFKEQQSKLNKKNSSKTQEERRVMKTSRVKSRVGRTKKDDICELQSKIEKLNLDDTSSPTDIVFQVPTLFSDTKMPAPSSSKKERSQKKQLDVTKDTTSKRTTKSAKVNVAKEESLEDDLESLKLELSSDIIENDVITTDSPEVIASPEKPKRRGRPKTKATEESAKTSVRKSSRTASTSAASKNRLKRVLR
ncbi:unnamed protein product, partial [Meganyctiphanes norvegica]